MTPLHPTHPPHIGPIHADARIPVPATTRRPLHDTDDSDNTHTTHTNNDDDVTEDDTAVQKQRNKSWWFLQLLSHVAILGDSNLSVILAFILFLIAVVVQQQQQHQPAPESTNVPDPHLHHYHHHRHSYNSTLDPNVSVALGKFTTYESLGPLPAEIASEVAATAPHIYHVGPTHSHLPLTTTTMITPEMIQDYHRDGVIAIRGLIPPALLQRLDDETTTLISSSSSTFSSTSQQQFHTVAHAALFRPIHPNNSNPPNHYRNCSQESTCPPQPPALMEVALWSSVSIVAATLLQLPSTKNHTDNHNNETVRVIRDIFLAKDDGPYVCGWHVDDFGFWPALPPPPTPSSSSLSEEGINAWIALDDMILTDETGGFALAVQSHTAIWNETAYNITGAPTRHNVPRDGYHNASHMFQQRIGYGTCNIERTAPHIHRRMEEMKRIYPVQRGDVIFHTRYLFHRTVPITSTPKRNDPDRQVYRRYSIRYGKGSTTIIPPGYGTELSVLYDPSNGGRSADAICSKDRVPWYPQAYPHMEGRGREQFWKEYAAMIQHHLPLAEERLKLRKQEMRPYLRQLAQEQSSSSKSWAMEKR